MQAVPVLRIRHLVQSERFYCDVLGFKVDWRWREAEGLPVFMQISRDGLRLYLTEQPLCEFGGLVYLYVDDVDRWYSDILKTSTGVDALPQDKPWGNREMQISDPDGNRLRICTSFG
jgi:uncharacterized glyoxalase superfamily protein PhnB